MKLLLLMSILIGWTWAQSSIATGEPVTVGTLTVRISQVDPPATPLPSRVPLDFYRVVVVTTNPNTAEIRVSLTASLPVPHPNVQTLDYNRVQNNASFDFPVPKGSVISKPMVTELPLSVKIAHPLSHQTISP